jgi:hypothetical protein
MQAARACAAALALALLAGCGTSDDARQADRVVQRFYQALGAHRGGAACAQLGSDTVKQLESQSGQSCSSVITRLKISPGPIVATHVFATSAKVDAGSGESAFLDREPEGWRISAAGCKPREGKPRDRPFDCEAEA